jgi:vacuolar-type H+-ATPase subunit F/Vma7
MPAPVYLGDETSGAGFALAGVRVRVPAVGTESAAFALARGEAPLVLVSAAVAARVPEPELRRACLALAPLVVVVPDLAGTLPLPDLAAQLGRELGLETPR